MSAAAWLRSLWRGTSVNEPPPLPPEPAEPEDLDYRIEARDWWKCSPCNGLGGIPLRIDWETGAYEAERCRSCDGTGLHRGIQWTEAER